MIPLDIAKVSNRLKTNRLGRKLHYFVELGSTNTHARELAEAGAAEGEIVIAEAQNQGRGRLGRRWESPPFANLYFSIILRPRLAPAHAPQITLMAAVALAEAVHSLIDDPPTIKWPNDILFEGRKLAGVLAEAACDSEQVNHVILGIGINLNYRVDAMPAEIRRRATSIAELTRTEVNRETVLVRLIHSLDRCYGELDETGFEMLRRRWDRYFGLRGERVRIEHLDEILTGRARGVAEDGALIIEDDHGVLQYIYAGDVIPVDR